MSEQLTNSQLLLRTVAMPADTNANGDIFGGWIMSQMDLAGGILAKKVSQGRTVTVAVDQIVFHRPVQVGDVVCCHGRVVRSGTTSVTIELQIWVNPILRDDEHQRLNVTSANFVYVAIDDHGQKRPLPRENQGLLAHAQLPAGSDEKQASASQGKAS
ncbi:MAG: acyl-CoA thioester hydrolase YciA [Polyangiaceae bacterium]|nr:acyl-CoA thioester hydrolase YciA [Polyangiaceae bacterium]